MPATKNRKWAAVAWMCLLLLAVPGGAQAGLQAQGLQAQGLQAQGLQAQGLQAQGLQAQGLQAQGLQAQGLQAQGLQAQGLQAQGLQAQGLQAQGLQAQGLQAQGVAVEGNDVVMSDFKGVEISSVEIKGLTSDSAITPHVLTNIPTMSAGPGNYITVGGLSVQNHYAVAHLVDGHGNPAEDIDLFIAQEQQDPVPNLFHRFEEQQNQDELYVVYFFHKWSGQWMSLCPYNAATSSASAMAIPEDPANPNKFIFACTATGVASKCARNWGYKPWSKAEAYVYDATANGGLGAWDLQSFDLKPYYDVCIDAARAGYCQDGKSYTKAGTLVDLFDTRQIIWPNSIENPFSATNPDSQWMMAQEYFISTGPSPLISSLQDSALQRTRYRELSPIGECDNMSYVDRLEHDHVEDGRWASPLTNIPRLQVFSPTYCTHNEYEVGPELPWDCSPCTTQVCKAMPGCCGAGPTPGWTAACTAYASTQCQSNGVQWPVGKVWPRDIPAGPTIPAKYLLGPGGAVTAVDGVSGSGSSVTVSGWACDPEWPGASVAVRIYGGAPREQGGTLLGEVRADQVLATPLAAEVGAACDGPTVGTARHGFTLTLPVNQTGNVFAYAIDEATTDGPAAPPTLIRNGIVHVPRCAHSEHVAGEALADTCSACAASICGDGSHAECCTVAWTDACASAADTCAPAESSAPVNSRSFTAVTTGWIEAPTTGAYTFQASELPSRLYVNGTKLLDWFEAPGTTSGSITLQAGQRYHLRWDRFQAEPPSGTPGPGVTWQPPLTFGQTAIPSANLYAIAPGSGSGLTARYFSSPGFGGSSVTRTDAVIDVNQYVAPPGTTTVDLPSGYGPAFSAIWEGEFVPSYTEAYNFIVVGNGSATLTINGAAVTFPAPAASSAPGGCAHDLCQLGDKLDASCNSCVQAICDKDPFCCDGGYLSYYTTEPVWDARCIAEVATYCAPSKCTAPLPSPSATQKKSAPIALQAGVHYTIKLEYSNGSSDKTVRLLWASDRQAKQAIPQFALYPASAVATGTGAGLNVTYFATKRNNGTVAPDLTKALGAGMVGDFSLTPTVDEVGLPAVSVLADTVDATSGKPAPPTVVRPRYEEEVFVDGATTVHVSGIGAVGSGYVRITGASAVLVPVGPGGAFEADVPVGLGAQVLKLSQQTDAVVTPCIAPALCAVSSEITWPITVTLATASPKAPVILSPTDPTHSPAPAPLVLNVVGTGTPAPVHVVDQGSVPNVFANIVPDAQGKFSGQITLDPGDAGNPSKGWHKLVFDQGGAASHPVFVSVGIDPPTVVFPRNGGEIDCEQPDPQGEQIAFGTLPYPQEVFGRLRVMEETGRTALAFVGAETQVGQPQPGQPTVFLTHFNPGPGRHVVYFFQAPDPPPNSTQDQIDEHFRAYARIADTPTSRIVVERKPPRFPIPQGVAGVIGGRGAAGGVFTNLPPPGQTGSLVLGANNCGFNANPPLSILCALPNADVNIRVNGRLYTQRADADGKWSLPIPLPNGWNHLTLAQVSDSRVGGAWSESCLSNEIDVGVQSPGAPVVTVPPDITVNATGPKGAQVYYPNVTAVRPTDGASVPVVCVPPAGSFFGVGRNEVLCTATDPTTGAVGLGEFAITVIDGPPSIKAENLTLEATGPAGTTLNAYTNVTTFDAVDPAPALECVPSVPHLFLLDQTMPVECTVTDNSNQSASAQFTVRVVDTTPPDPCTMKDLKVGSSSGSGAIVNYAVCNASDIVDGSIPMACDRPPGSFFPLGKTLVTCAATDKHANRSSSTTFTVEVGDTTPPVLKLPGPITAIATSKAGARVSYTVTATDNSDPKPTVKCTPPSGALFPLGSTTVNCTATDITGNKSTGSFVVKVIVGWGGFLAPVNQDGSSRFLLGLPIALRFALTGASANVCDLDAKLFLAPLDAAGRPGAERPAAGLPPGAGNLFYFIPIINQYAMLLDTRPLSVGPWQLRVDLGDGEIHTQKITMVRAF